MTTSSAQVLLDAFGRIPEVAGSVLDGLDPEQLLARVGPEANPIGWLVWHLARVQDDHVADVAGAEQRWTADGWAEKFGLPYEESAIGYGQDADDVARFAVTEPDRLAELLTGYLDAVHAVTVSYLEELSDDDLERVVDENWDPPVTLLVRLVSVISDDLQHAGQAAYVKGLL